MDIQIKLDAHHGTLCVMIEAIFENANDGESVVVLHPDEVENDAEWIKKRSEIAVAILELSWKQDSETPSLAVQYVGKSLVLKDMVLDG
ncbi:MAG TPA: hypothetical protein VJI96_02475 [Candidatus Andersenbacteria bacterium]|nr:hypothetical protein [Candidatus Andersenbacteria bacterium]